ncbi:hypothetical protein BCR24_15735 [Enterococcus ureilyticus]|uniref:Uncharacterized protein n=1 Tax=Enterococcus ureilyticus TaxID=1131292 RepID=A0A1E5HBS3_9ENTE|nr:hypothetical protein [Enterococcus ureilyticus]MBM7690568.1 hypothetical protein [Enterococcus ureilyticus]MBO0446326.1 hypothetical protein [Enterococcus ureilyticus]OEG22394.1 hypothetical protein BCR24_15735 [Enterococcus ureilyticus]
MELTTSQVGMILHGMYMSDYFESEDLEEALQQLIDDTESTIGITVQTELPSVDPVIERLVKERKSLIELAPSKEQDNFIEAQKYIEGFEYAIEILKKDG